MEPVSKPLALLPQAAYSSSAGTITSTPVTFSNVPNFGSFLVRITQAPSTSSALLDIFVQSSVNYALTGPSSSNGAAIWDDFIHFTQLAGAGTLPSSVMATWTATVAPSSSLNMHTAATATLTAGQIINGLQGGSWRVQAVVSGTAPAVASSSAWAFSVVLQTGR